MVLTCVLFCLKELAALAGFLLLLNRGFGETPRLRLRGLLSCAAVCVCVWAAGFFLLTPATQDAWEILDFLATVTAAAATFLLFRRPRVFRSVAVLFIYYGTGEMLWSFLSPLFSQRVIPELVFGICASLPVIAGILRVSAHKTLNLLAGAFSELPWWMLAALLLFELSAYYKEFGMSRAWYNVLYAVSACLMFLSLLWLAARVLYLIHTQKSILQRLNEQLLYESQKERSDEALRRFRHDYKNHVIALNAMLEHGDLNGARAYMDELTRDASGTLQRFSTGNSVVNSLLNVKYAAALRQNTELRFDGMIPEWGIAPKDMCVCVGNLLDNALEACASLPEGAPRYVKTTASVTGNILLLTTENPIGETASLPGGALPKTTKIDPKRHGIGLKNVKDISKKYNGSLTLSSADRRFTAELLLELQEGYGEENEEIR
ncbi:MAG: GHKL domain-containing protein [Clostridia bacterium]|nr:GHKL domain-containing protein [Clostridia bacterium]